MSERTVSEIATHIQAKIDSHWGCRGSKYCPQCIGYRQILDYINFGGSYAPPKIETACPNCVSQLNADCKC